MTFVEIKEILHFPQKDTLIVSLKAPKEVTLLTGQFLIIGDNYIEIKGIVLDLPRKSENIFGKNYKRIDCMINNNNSNKDLEIGDLLILGNIP